MSKWWVTTGFCFSAFLAASALAEPAKKPVAPEMSIRDQAIMENQSIDKKAYKKTIQASEAQQANVSSFLKLKDPTPELHPRTWLWDLDFKLQSLTPKGVGHVGTFAFGLDDYGPGLMPSVNVGVMSKVSAPEPVLWSTGLAVDAGYMTQNTSLISPTGYEFSGTHLNTSLLGGVWKNEFRPATHPKWAYRVEPEYGVINYTQSGSLSSVANFSQHGNFFALGLGVDYSFRPEWGILAQYTYRDTGNKTDDSQIQKDNFEIGTTITW